MPFLPSFGLLEFFFFGCSILSTGFLAISHNVHLLSILPLFTLYLLYLTVSVFHFSILTFHLTFYTPRFTDVITLQQYNSIYSLSCFYRPNNWKGEGKIAIFRHYCLCRELKKVHKELKKQQSLTGSWI